MFVIAFACGQDLICHLSSRGKAKERLQILWWWTQTKYILPTRMTSHTWTPMTSLINLVCIIVVDMD